MRFRKQLLAAALLATGLGTGVAHATPISLTKRAGIAGGTVAATAVFRADLSGAGIGTLQSITIRDNSFGIGGSAGQFSGFDLDAIILSTSSCDTALCVAGLSPLSAFNYSSGVILPRAHSALRPIQLFGTGPTGSTVDNAVATLGLFDGESIAGPGADGFLSLGDGGKISFNLSSALSTTGLYLYLGEVGDNGEALAGEITISQESGPRARLPFPCWPSVLPGWESDAARGEPETLAAPCSWLRAGGSRRSGG